jgi:hypothetical protein
MHAGLKIECCSRARASVRGVGVIGLQRAGPVTPGLETAPTLQKSRRTLRPDQNFAASWLGSRKHRESDESERYEQQRDDRPQAVFA